jgi:DNA-3-methyladenine glycosylase I
VAYHDREWGTPEFDSRKLWEKLMLDAFQAGLSWLLILRKRDALRKAFANFDPARVARFGPADVQRLLGNAGIVRSKAKIEATIAGARAFLAMRASGEELSDLAWDRVGRVPIQNHGPAPAQSELSAALSKELKLRGFRFVGPVIVYAWMQAVGIVNDHAAGCFRRGEVSRLGRRGPPRPPGGPATVGAPRGRGVRARRSPPARAGTSARPRRATPS